ncbi:MAG TPA: hypothetical protein VKA34_19250 [Balneolales bacterium]|nr:hypothetical protein [Balneolales bacterium]
MKITLLDLSKEEHSLVENAQSEFGLDYINAHDLVFFTWSFISSVKPIAYVFSLFLSQIQKSLVLCLLSALRDHDVQFHMMLRQTLENASLAAYALFETDQNAFCTIDEHDILYVKEKVNKKAYNWLEKNYKDHSDKIKKMKDVINDSYAHASILPTSQNTYLNGNNIGNQFFDSHDKLMTKQRLWWVGNVALGVLDLLAKIADEFPIVTLVDNFPQKMSSLSKENNRILSELKNNPRFSRWMNR